jgi:hypothetical protein
LGPSLSEAARRALTKPKRKSSAKTTGMGQTARLQPKLSEITGLRWLDRTGPTAISEGDMQNCHQRTSSVMAISAIG